MTENKMPELISAVHEMLDTQCQAQAMRSRDGEVKPHHMIRALSTTGTFVRQIQQHVEMHRDGRAIVNLVKAFERS